MEWSSTHEDLFKKINQEWDDYARSMWDLPGYAVFGKAKEIAAIGFCYNQVMKHIYDYQAEDLEWLLNQPKPLETLRSRWTDEQPVDFDVEFDRFFRNSGYKGPKSGVDMTGLS